MGNSNVAATYKQNAVLTASPEKVLKLLYEGAVSNLERARIALSDPATRQNALVGESLSKAIGILGELRGALDHSIGGKISKDLDRLYEFALDQLSTANLQRQPDGVVNALKVLKTLQEAWDAVIPG